MPFKPGEGRPPMNISESEIRYAMANTQSCAGAARFLKVSYEAFRKYAKLYKDSETGKFGRILGEIFVDGININKKMCTKGHAVEYYGQSKTLIEQAHLKNRKRHKV